MTIAVQPRSLDRSLDRLIDSFEPARNKLDKITKFVCKFFELCKLFVDEHLDNVLDSSVTFFKQVNKGLKVFGAISIAKYLHKDLKADFEAGKTVKVINFGILAANLFIDANKWIVDKAELVGLAEVLTNCNKLLKPALILTSVFTIVDKKQRNEEVTMIDYLGVANSIVGFVIGTTLGVTTAYTVALVGASIGLYKVIK